MATATPATFDRKRRFNAAFAGTEEAAGDADHPWRVKHRLEQSCHQLACRNAALTTERDRLAKERQEWYATAQAMGKAAEATQTSRQILSDVMAKQCEEM